MGHARSSNQIRRKDKCEQDNLWFALGRPTMKKLRALIHSGVAHFHRRLICKHYQVVHKFIFPADSFSRTHTQTTLPQREKVISYAWYTHIEKQGVENSHAGWVHKSSAKLQRVRWKTKMRAIQRDRIKNASCVHDKNLNWTISHQWGCGARSRGWLVAMYADESKLINYFLKHASSDLVMSCHWSWGRRAHLTTTQWVRVGVSADFE